VLSNRRAILVVNFKNFHEIFGEKALELALDVQDVSTTLEIPIIVSPPVPVISIMVKSLGIPVYSQHVDVDAVGSSTGAVIPELLQSLGVRGSILNHSERRIPIKDIEELIKRLRKIGMKSLVCARTPEEVGEIARLGPDMLAVEPPELIGSGRAVSKVAPEIVSDSVRASKRVNPKVQILCGAGVVSPEDVEISLRLGAEGVLVASGIVRAQDWKSKIMELARPLRQ